MSRIPRSHAGADSPSPPASRIATPSWLDTRLVVGLLLVLLSVVLGARLVAAADHTTPVWSAARDLSAGTVLAAGDLAETRVRLGDGAERYVAAGVPPVGRVLSRPVGAGELLPAAALARDAAGDQRLVTVPVERFHYPQGIGPGQRVDVYMTPRRAPGATATTTSAPRLVVDRVPVARVDTGSSGLGAATTLTGVTLTVAPDDVRAVVAAVQQGAVDLVRVPQDAP